MIPPGGNWTKVGFADGIYGCDGDGKGAYLTRHSFRVRIGAEMCGLTSRARDRGAAAGNSGAAMGLVKRLEFGRLVRRLCLGLSLLALLLQGAALGMPMPASAAGLPPAWLADSLCGSNDGGPADPIRHVCPICFVVAQAGSALAPQLPTIAAPSVLRVGPALPSTRSGPPRRPAGAIAEPRAPPAAALA